MDKRNYNELKKCCFSGKEVENDDHLFQCAKQPAFRNKIIKALDKLKNGIVQNSIQDSSILCA